MVKKEKCSKNNPINGAGTKPISAGEAYAFFDCDANYERLQRHMPEIRKDAGVLEGLELTLHEGISDLKLDKTLARQVRYPFDYRILSSERARQEREQGIEPEQRPAMSLKYAFLAKLSGASNEATARILSDLVQYIHGIFDEDYDMLRCAVVYKNGRDYQLLD